jgi:hypothetical protein
MIIVETPVKSIEAEMVSLALANGPSSALYARGAYDALAWILFGTTKPSEGPVLGKEPFRGH